MDKSILKKFAIESRQDLMNKIRNIIKTFYVEEEFKKEQKGEVYLLSNEKHSLSLTKEENDKRDLLIKRIKELTLEQVIEEAAYTWFNRIIAIRYMEINDMLPLTKNNSSLGIRVLSSKDNTPDPEILKFTNLINPDLDIDFKKEKYVELKDDNEKFKYVLLLICKKLGKVIPQVFDGNTDYIDILIPDNLLNDTGFVNKIITEVPESNYNQVEIIGWLYQYYISDQKAQVFKNVQKGMKVTKNDIPSATQLFTPDWIVKYMIDNTVGQYIINKDSLEYYIDIDKIKINDNFENVKFLDPCCGSGHILVYAFEVFYKGYLERGYSKELAVRNTILNNIHGIDLDARATQLSILSICLKAREYDKMIFNRDIIKDLKIINILSSNNINKEIISYHISKDNMETMDYILDKFKDADEYGSLIQVEEMSFQELKNDIREENFLFANELLVLLNQAEILSQKYEVVCTNPPYMGRKNMNSKLSNYLQEYYPKNKSEMYSAFIEQCNKMTKDGGLQAMITIHTWMFISSFEETRKLLLNKSTILNMVHTGPSTFPDLASFNVLATSFVVKKEIIDNYHSVFVRLSEYYNIQEKIDNFNNKNNYYYLVQEKFKQIPGFPIIYWINDCVRNIFKNNKKIGDLFDVKVGLQTGCNEKFLKFWWEIQFDKVGFNCKDIQESVNSGKKWFPYNKGGDYRKWYGNNEYVVNWQNDGKEIRNYSEDGKKIKSRPQNTQYYFKKGITWSFFGFENFGVRYKDYGFIFDVLGSSMFLDDDEIFYMIGYLCSNLTFYFLSLIAPTVAFQVGNIMSLPYKTINNKSEINKLVKENINLCKNDWDCLETSWDCKGHSLLRKDNENRLINIVNTSEKEFMVCREKLRENEEKLNRIYSEIYEIDSVNCKVNDRDLTLKKFDILNNIKSLISYTVGCMFGRYSLDENGLIYAGGEFDSSKYKTFKADDDNIIPINDESYFNDDIVNRFKRFIEVVYGKETLNENLDYIAETLGKKGTETSEDTIRRYFVNDFYNDHIKTYQKRPIYWLFDSGKKNGFKCLIYMHRYSKDLVASIRTKYIPKVQTTYEKLLSDVEYRLSTELSLNDKKEMEKKKIELNGKIQEVKEYYEKIANVANRMIDIDLDDGVVTNYAKFTYLNPKTNKEESILGKIK